MMTKFERIYSMILIAVMAIELVGIIVMPVVDVVSTGNWSQLQAWVLVPWLLAEIYIIRFVNKHWEDIR